MPGSQKSETPAPKTESAPSNTEMQSYEYDKYIKSPDKIGISSRGTLSALSADIKGINDYVNVIGSGNSKAQAVSPLGNKYFMDTGASCKDTAGQTQARYAFINNIPDGKFAGKGLVPGILEDLTQVNPSAIFLAFKGESQCQQITMSTRDVKNKNGSESRYVLQTDIDRYNPCWFPDKRNPVNKSKCEGMQSQFPNDPVLQSYYVGLGALGAYIMYRLMNKQ